MGTRAIIFFGWSFHDKILEIVTMKILWVNNKWVVEHSVQRIYSASLCGCNWTENADMSNVKEDVEFFSPKTKGV